MPTPFNEPPEFEDILDGYFPLSLSIYDLLRRRGLTCAQLYLTHAPILHVDGLPIDAPVPLNIHSGRAGMIERAHLLAVICNGLVQLSGRALWRWLDGAPPASYLDPMIRLAEPAFLEGHNRGPDDMAGDMVNSAQTGIITLDRITDG